MTTEEVKTEAGYAFECNMSEEYKNYDVHDEWGCAYVWTGENQNLGAEYNFCIQDDGSNCCAIYKMELNEETDYMETDYSTFVHYEIDFKNENWKEALENAMCDAMIKFFELEKNKTLEKHGMIKESSLDEKLKKAKVSVGKKIDSNKGGNDYVTYKESTL